ncbi:hypothetical protein U9M48_001745 [Paspalum notatum var. saurae]|uniref:Uncharacterized protein n=1 Tax=Paspalum notatum var. saurae TaxID=547442 RepID=A0AAQ3PJX0_PASNO
MFGRSEGREQDGEQNEKLEAFRRPAPAARAEKCVSAEVKGCVIRPVFVGKNGKSLGSLYYLEPRFSRHT